MESLERGLSRRCSSELVVPARSQAAQVRSPRWLASAHNQSPAEATDATRPSDDVVGARSDRPGGAKPAGTGVPGHLRGHRRPRTDDGRPGGGGAAAGARPDRTGAVGNLHRTGQAGHIAGPRPRAETTSTKDTSPPRVTRNTLGDTRTLISLSWHAAGAAPASAVGSGPADGTRVGRRRGPEGAEAWAPGAARVSAVGRDRRRSVPLLIRTGSATRRAGWVRHRVDRSAVGRGAPLSRNRPHAGKHDDKEEANGKQPAPPIDPGAPAARWAVQRLPAHGPASPNLARMLCRRPRRASHDTMRAWDGARRRPLTGAGR